MIPAEEVARIKREACEQMINEFRSNEMLNPVQAHVMRNYAHREYPAQPKRVRAEVTVGGERWEEDRDGGWHKVGAPAMQFIATPGTWMHRVIQQIRALEGGEVGVSSAACGGSSTAQLVAFDTSESPEAAPSPAPPPAPAESTDSFNSGESTPAFTPAPPESTETRVWLTWKRGASSAVAVLPEVAHWTQAQWDARYPWDAPHILLVPRASLDALRKEGDNEIQNRHEWRLKHDALRLQLDEAQKERDHWRGAFDEASLHTHAAAEFRGNSVGHWYDKATAYGRIVGELHEISGAKGGTDVRDAVRTLRAQLAEATRDVTQEELAKACAAMKRESHTMHAAFPDVVEKIARAALKALGKKVEGA